MCPIALQVDQRSESVLLPIYGVMVPFHILTIKNATNNQDGDHSYIRINFNFGPSFEPGTKFPNAIFIKELSFRSADTRHSAKVGLAALLVTFPPEAVKHTALGKSEVHRADQLTSHQQDRGSCANLLWANYRTFEKRVKIYALQASCGVG